MLDCGPQTTAGAANVVLVSLDHSCIFSPLRHRTHADDDVLAVRLKAPARQFDAANEKDIGYDIAIEAAEGETGFGAGAGSGVNDEGEYDDEVEDGEAYERLGSAFDRYGGAGAGSGVGTTGVGGVYGRYEARRRI